MSSKEELQEMQALRRRRRGRQLLGALVCFLVVVGLFSIVGSGIDLAATLLDDTEEKQMFEERLKTLVALDPLPFDSLEEANVNTLLHAAIGASVDSTRDDYERDENGAMYLPTLDIETTLLALYGPDFQFEYQTFEDHGITFTYVPEKQAYLLPVTSAISNYYPKVTEIKKESGGVKRVTVGYVSPFQESGAFDPNAQPDPVKYQDYLFKKNGSDYYLYAIVESQAKVQTAQSASTAQGGQDTVQQGTLESMLGDSLPTVESTSLAVSEQPAA